MINNKKPLIVIAGPTACGKTNLSIELAKLINGEIISGDSMQIYKYMNIGTAKITDKEMNNINHYMIDEIYPDEEFNIKIFKEKAVQYMSIIYNNNKLPILCGGTGFYINALVNDNNFMETTTNHKLRDYLYNYAEKFGNLALHKKLEEIDPDSAKKIHYNNIKRIIRAIEFFENTKIPISLHNKEEKEKLSPYNIAFIVLNMKREILYDKINIRVDNMIKSGLVQEVKKLIDMGYNENLVAMKGIGYKELIPYINNKISLEDAIYEIKKSTRHFAKRQITWFKRQTKNSLWIDLSEMDKKTAIEKILIYIKNLKIIDD